MKKELFSRIFVGLLGGIVIGYLFTIGISLAIGDGSYYSCVPSLIERFGNEVTAIIIQTVLSAVLGALNGLYRQLISTSLYGANLSQTALDAMGHFYTYPPSQPSGNKLSATLFFLCNGRSEEYGAAESIFADIWKSGYNTLLNINYFLKSMEGSTAVIGSNNKDVLMGEAYGLRAYLHFDLFRLFEIGRASCRERV